MVNLTGVKMLITNSLLPEVEKLEDVTAELHQMCLKVVEKVIASDELMTKFRILNTPGVLYVNLADSPAIALFAS